MRASGLDHIHQCGIESSMTSNYDFALPTLKFRQLSVIWNPRRRQSASVGQQDTLDYNWGELYRSTGPRADGVTEIATGIWGDVAVGKANSSNAEPVETAIRTPRMGHSIVEWEVMTGT
jgi:hypothetical protein